MTLTEEIIEAVSTERIAAHIRALEGVRHPIAAPAALEAAADYLRDQLQRLGYGMTDHCFGEEGCKFINIVANKPGLLQDAERVLVLAHYDTVAETPGADDNASGLAVLLEVARVLKPYRFARRLQFVAVNLEENAVPDQPGSGLRGSSALAQYAQDKGWDIKAVVVLESVAYAGADLPQHVPPGIPVPVPEMGDFLAAIGNERSAHLLRTLQQGVERHAIPLPVVYLAVPGNGEVLPDVRRSDHAPFWDRGYPAVMLTDTTNFRNPHYHGAGDTFDTLNLDFATAVCRATSLLLSELAALQPQPPLPSD